MILSRVAPGLSQSTGSYFEQTVMFNSFFGLEKPLCLPPNYRLTGPIGKPPAQLIESFKKKDMSMYEWMEDALAKNEPVVYVSLGSMCQWQPWTVNAMYKGLKEVGCRVVWSIKDEFIQMCDEDPTKDPKFIVRAWMP